MRDPCLYGQIDSPPAMSWRALDCRRVRVVLVTVFCIYFAWLFLTAGESSLFTEVYIDAAQRMLRHEPIHAIKSSAYAYPPAMAFVMTPLVSLSPAAAIGVWYVLNMAAAAVVVASCWRLAGGAGFSRLTARWAAILALGMAIEFRFFIAPLLTQQFDMVIAALLFAGCWHILRGGELRGAALIGAAAAMKCTPLLFVPYLAWRRKFAAAAIAMGVAVGLNLLPDMVLPQASGRFYLQDWVDTYVRPAAKAAPGSWIVMANQNQSLGGALGRLADFGLPFSEPSVASAWRPSGPRWLRPTHLAAAAALLLFAGWYIRSPLRPWRTGLTLRVDTSAYGQRAAQDAGQEPTGQLRFSLECGAVACLMLLLSPMSSKAHFVVMLLPCFLMARWFVERRGSRLRWLMVALVVFGPLCTKGVLGKSLGNLALLWSFPVWFVVVSLVWLCLAMRAIDSIAAPHRPIPRPWFLRRGDSRRNEKANLAAKGVAR